MISHSIEGPSVVVLPNEQSELLQSAIVVDGISHFSRRQTKKRPYGVQGLSGYQIRRNIIGSILLLIGLFSIAVYVVLTTTSDFDGSYDGYKETQALDENHWLITDDERGVVFGAILYNNAEHVELKTLLSGLSAPNGLTVDTTNKRAYVTDSDTLELYRIQFDLETQAGYEVSALEMAYLKPSMMYPKKAILYPDGQKLILADQSSNELYLVDNLAKWPDVSIVTLTDASTLDKPHGMAWLESSNATQNFTVPPYGDSVAPQYIVSGNQYVAPQGLLVANKHKISFVRTDESSLKKAADGSLQTPVDIVDMTNSFGLKHADSMSVQFVPSGGGSFLVLSKNSCGVFLVKVLNGDIDWVNDVDRNDDFRIIGHEDPGCTVNNPHGMTCLSSDSESNYNGCLIAQPGKYGGGKLAWLHVPHGNAFKTKSNYKSWNIKKHKSSVISTSELYDFAAGVHWVAVEAL